MNVKSNSPAKKEVRFTRNAQALHFFVLALLFFCLGAGLYLVSLDIWSVSQEPLLQQSWYGLLTLPFILGFLWIGVHLARHAYLIFSPVGIEIFPFFFPSKNMEVIYWAEVHDVRLTADKKMMEVTLTGEPERKVFVTTAPLDRASCLLLEHTLDGIRERRGNDKSLSTEDLGNS